MNSVGPTGFFCFSAILRAVFEREEVASAFDSFNIAATEEFSLVEGLGLPWKSLLALIKSLRPSRLPSDLATAAC